MVSDQQVKRLWRLAGQKWALEIAAAKAGMPRRRRESTCGIGAYQARWDKSIHGERGLIRSPIAGRDSAVARR